MQENTKTILGYFMNTRFNFQLIMIFALKKHTILNWIFFKFDNLKKLSSKMS